jgi:hypothetical protein
LSVTLQTIPDTIVKACRIQLNASDLQTCPFTSVMSPSVRIKFRDNGALSARVDYIEKTNREVPQNHDLYTLKRMSIINKGHGVDKDTYIWHSHYIGYWDVEYAAGIRIISKITVGQTWDSEILIKGLDMSECIQRYVSTFRTRVRLQPLCDVIVRTGRSNIHEKHTWVGVQYAGDILDWNKVWKEMLDTFEDYPVWIHPGKITGAAVPKHQFDLNQDTRDVATKGVNWWRKWRKW